MQPDNHAAIAAYLLARDTYRAAAARAAKAAARAAKVAEARAAEARDAAYDAARDVAYDEVAFDAFVAASK